MTRTMLANPETDGYHDKPHAEVQWCTEVKPYCQHAPVTMPGTDGAPKSKGAYDPPPVHYGGGTQIDPWAVWDAFDLDRYTANAVKYLLRAGKKDIAPRLDDLRKARNYIAKAIEMEENRERPPSS